MKQKVGVRIVRVEVRTRERSRKTARRMREMGFPAHYVAQVLRLPREDVR